MADELLSVAHCEAELSDLDEQIKTQGTLLKFAVNKQAFTAMQKLSNQLAGLKSRRNYVAARREAMMPQAGVSEDVRRARVLEQDLPTLARHDPAFAEAMRRRLEELLGPRLELVHDADKEERA